MNETEKMIDDGGSAFPCPEVWDNGSPIAQGTSGMLLRDWFAGRADIPWNLVADTIEKNTGNKNPSVGEIVKYRASMKYAEADAMLAARKPQPESKPC